MSTLKWTVSPWSTLISVLKPWMLAEPEPLTSHSLAGSPGFEFSQTISFAIGGSQGAACAVAGLSADTAANASMATASAIAAAVASLGLR